MADMLLCIYIGKVKCMKDNWDVVVHRVSLDMRKQEAEENNRPV